LRWSRDYAAAVYTVDISKPTTGPRFRDERQTIRDKQRDGSQYSKVEPQDCMTSTPLKKNLDGGPILSCVYLI
jgi:hypothetical protein